MKAIISQVGRVETEYFVVELSEPTRIGFGQQVEDVIVSSPDIEILVGWDYAQDADFNKTNCLLVKPFDNMKELSKERCTNFYLMPRNDGEKGTVYVTVTR